MAGLLYRLGYWCARHGWRVLAGWVVLASAVVALGTGYGGTPVDSIRLPDAQSTQALDLLGERFPALAGDSASVAVARGDRADLRRDPQLVADAEQVAAAARRIPGVVEVVSPFNGAGLLSPDGGVALLEVRFTVGADEIPESSVTALEAAAEPLRGPGRVVGVGGPVVDAKQMPEPGPAELVGVAAAAVILFLAFGSVVAMGLPLLIATVGVGIGLSGVALLAAVFDTASVAQQIGVMLGLATGIDYALLLLTRHRTQLAAGMDTVESVARANATAGLSVLVAGGTVVVAILGLWVTGIAFLGSIGTGAALSIAAAVLLAVTLLPALLGLLGPRINHGTLPRRARTPGARTASGARWQRWAGHVTRRPWPYLLGSVLVLLVLAAPALSMRLGFPDAGNDEAGTGTRTVYDLTAEAFGAGANGPLVVAVDLPGDDAQDTAVLSRLTAALQVDPQVAAVNPSQTSPDHTAAVLSVIPRTSPQSQATTELVQRLRETAIPAALLGAPAGTRALLGGFTATQVDLDDAIADSLLPFIAAVVALSFLLLVVVFRSLLVPLKAAVLNLLSIGAAYGVVVAVFQWGWALDLVGLDRPVPIISFLPVLAFAIVFGLSMDYEVFLLSRIREDYLVTRDSHASVATGLATTGRVITSAAAIMVAVFGAFALGDSFELKLIGLTLGVAVLLDATLIRMVLVPATMALLGDANWWLPHWLDRLLPHLHLDGQDAAPNATPPAAAAPALTGVPKR